MPSMGSLGRLFRLASRQQKPPKVADGDTDGREASEEMKDKRTRPLQTQNPKPLPLIPSPLPIHGKSQANQPNTEEDGITLAPSFKSFSVANSFVDSEPILPPSAPVITQPVFPHLNDSLTPRAHGRASSTDPPTALSLRLDRLERLVSWLVERAGGSVEEIVAGPLPGDATSSTSASALTPAMHTTTSGFGGLSRSVPVSASGWKVEKPGSSNITLAPILTFPDPAAPTPTNPHHHRRVRGPPSLSIVTSHRSTPSASTSMITASPVASASASPPTTPRPRPRHHTRRGGTSATASAGSLSASVSFGRSLSHSHSLPLMPPNLSLGQASIPPPLSLPPPHAEEEAPRTPVATEPGVRDRRIRPDSVCSTDSEEGNEWPRSSSTPKLSHRPRYGTNPASNRDPGPDGTLHVTSSTSVIAVSDLARIVPPPNDEDHQVDPEVSLASARAKAVVRAAWRAREGLPALTSGGMGTALKTTPHVGVDVTRSSPGDALDALEDLEPDTVSPEADVSSVALFALEARFGMCGDPFGDEDLKLG
ncbi:hypothetical protein HDU93_000687 [Gonapodya sp. JEL0774]|nr:hypothetical protein HDU93_000687 [Gonapodya sp. JEL0774]